MAFSNFPPFKTNVNVVFSSFSSRSGDPDQINVIGVLQLALKQKSNSFREEKTFVNDYFLNLIGIDEPLENSIRKYSEFVSTAIYLFKAREKTQTQTQTQTQLQPQIQIQTQSETAPTS